jgi:hypothetical protein
MIFRKWCFYICPFYKIYVFDNIFCDTKGRYYYGNDCSGRRYREASSVTAAAAAAVAAAGAAAAGAAAAVALWLGT